MTLPDTHLPDTHQPAVLLLDDDAELAQMLCRYLGQNGFAVRWVATIAAFHAALAQAEPALALVDVMLPDGDGLTLARSLAAERRFALMMLSARGDEVDRIVGYEVGADDYLPKPFNPRELLARMRAVLRRALPPVPTPAVPAYPPADFGLFTVDLAGHRLFRAGQEWPISTAEFTLLAVFLRHPRQVLSRDRLTDLVQGFERMPLDRSIDARVARLRKRLEEDTQNPRYIRTVWGVGYLFDPDGRAP